jgi:hypothetical protein
MIKPKKLRETGGFQKASAISAIVQSRRLGVVQNRTSSLVGAIEGGWGSPANEIPNILATKFRGLGVRSPGPNAVNDIKRLDLIGWQISVKH